MSTSLFWKQLRYLAATASGTATLGAGLLALGLLLWTCYLRPQHALTEDLAQQIALNQQRLAARAAGAHPALAPDATDAADALEAFYTAFTPAQAVPEVLKGVFRAAQQHRLQLDTGEYAQAELPGGRLRVYRVTLPLKGAMPAILGFVNDVLKATPGAALENLSVRRETVESSSVDAKLVLAFFMEVRP